MRAAVPVAVAVLTLAGAAASWYRMRPGPSFQGDALTRLTFDSGLTTDPVLSSDGKLLAYASDRAGGGNLDIWLRQVAGGEPVQITRDTADESQPDFSPDGTRIAFRSEREGGGLYVTSALGGGEQQLIAPEGRAARFSPDGRWIAYQVGEAGAPRGRPMRSKVFVMSLAGGQVRDMAPALPALPPGVVARFKTPAVLRFRRSGCSSAGGLVCCAYRWRRAGSRSRSGRAPKSQPCGNRSRRLAG